MQDPPCVCRLMLFCERENLYSLLLFSLKVSNGFTEFCSHEEITVFSITSSLSVPNECWILSISLKKFLNRFPAVFSSNYNEYCLFS